MKRKNNSNKIGVHTNTIGLKRGTSIGVIAGVFIAVFLSGKIFYIPKGTFEGGVISAIGVVVIIVFMIIVGLIINKIKISQ